MSLEIIHDDITKLKVDAIVNAAKNSLLGGGGVDGAIHRAAGPGLLEECRKLNGCKTGQAKITKGYNLPAKHVIHTVGPVWHGGNSGEEDLLRSCYKSSLDLAKANDLHSIAFPLISAGVYGYPKRAAYKVAVDTIKNFLEDNDMMVYMVIFGHSMITISHEQFAKIQNFCTKKLDKLVGALERPLFSRREKSDTAPIKDYLDNALDESFSAMLLRKIDQSGMTDSQCYRRANVDRRLFSKIKNEPNYRTSKRTALAFAIALEFSLDETRELLMKAGYALSHSDEFDLIIEYFIREGNYNIYEINDALFAFDLPLLG